MSQSDREHSQRRLLAEKAAASDPVLVMQPCEFMSAWSPENGRLRLPVSGPHRIGGRAAFLIRLADMKVHIVVTGVVRSIRRELEGRGVDLAPDGPGLRAIRRLVSTARGE
ncbi:MAG TPA: hypothetical protein VMK12_21735, partial [Anaeromyxobacteraceae bacterium]|nr:hypothetical protein [Anaeromyxobacteraceae bacterium]